MEIEVRLEHIEKMAEEREEENWGFRTFLKQLNIGIGELDAIVHEITDQFSSQIDCTKCANCCKQVRLVLDEEYISRLALGEKMTASDFKKTYLVPDEETPSRLIFSELPCPLLENDDFFANI
ncbi:YkgJ family cysteine cluster protein [Thermodesulfobacteriota bacterium]